MRLALVTIPRSWAAAMPLLMPGLRPKSSALTINSRRITPAARRRERPRRASRSRAHAAGSNRATTRATGRPDEGGQRRDPPARPAELVGVGARETRRILVAPRGGKRGQIEDARAHARHLPVDGAYARTRDKDVGGIELTVHEHARK